jgi:hypothetical protein
VRIKKLKGEMIVMNIEEMYLKFISCKDLQEIRNTKFLFIKTFILKMNVNLTNKFLLNEILDSFNKNWNKIYLKLLNTNNFKYINNIKENFFIETIKEMNPLCIKYI